MAADGFALDRVYDFHTHSTQSDGELSPVELIRRAHVKGYAAIAITDHAGPGSLERFVREVLRDCELCMKHWDIIAIPGVELTHVPPEAIDEVAAEAKRLGAKIVVVHGETIEEPVAPGTNAAAVRSNHVDILAHPGLISPEDARVAAENGVYLEISAGHALANGHVAAVARESGARAIVNSDGHTPGGLLTPEHALKVALGAGLTEAEAAAALVENPKRLLRKLAACAELSGTSGGGRRV